ncbi:hypothetical protein D0A34_25270 [Microcoleus vaginatus PCC 9802]|nr:hypothetical protein MicvaDRAFT_3211 [Microcoleus vaginatus FGP-2]UNU21711.1 hypothetical protein D0A34_25270 [Microcoleus vaginatus PCC 9802]
MVEAGGLTERDDTISPGRTGSQKPGFFIAIVRYSPPKRAKTRFRGLVHASWIVLETCYLRILRLSPVSGLVIKKN